MPGAREQQASPYQPPTTCTAAQPRGHGAWTASWLMAQASHKKRKGKQSEKFNIAWHHGRLHLGAGFSSFSSGSHGIRTLKFVALGNGTVNNDTMMSLDACNRPSCFPICKKYCKNIVKTMQAATWKIQINCKTCISEQPKFNQNPGDQPKISYKMSKMGSGGPPKTKNVIIDRPLLPSIWLTFLAACNSWLVELF